MRANPPLFGQGYAGVDLTKGEAQPLCLPDAIPQLQMAEKNPHESRRHLHINSQAKLLKNK